MKTKSEVLAERKKLLLAQASALRVGLHFTLEELNPLFAAGDKVVTGFGWIKKQPLGLVAIATGIVAARPHLVLSVIRKGIAVIPLIQRFRKLTR